MKIKDLSDFNQQEVESLLGRIPFFKELQLQASEQLQILLGYSCIVELDPGEKIMRRGDKGGWLYFLIKGRLAVFLDSAGDSAPLNYITPGELFGDLALLCEHKRKATVAAEQGNKKALLFATDFKPFGELDDFQVVSLQTKLIFYRTMVHSIRWRLEVNRMAAPDHPFALELRKVPSFGGEKGGEEELLSLFGQAKYLASVLERWNSDGASIQDVIVAHASQQ